MEFIQGRVGGGDKFSVMRCQSIGLMLVVRRVGKCGIQHSIGETNSMTEEILTHVVERHT